MKASDRVRLAVGYVVSLLGLAMVGCSVPLFWGPWKQVLAAPLLIACGCLGYLLGRVQVYWVRREVREDAERTA
jgi:ABC-type xylose transport system permease subunit